jgi:hypothetical protein
LHLIEEMAFDIISHKHPVVFQHTIPEQCICIHIKCISVVN